VNGEWRAPLEFTTGFFRFAHSMIRPAYRFNGDAPTTFDIQKILDRTSESSPTDVPLEAVWLVNWKYFLGDGPAVGNFSTRIGPWSQVGIAEEVWGEGNLIVRDLMSSIVVQPWSVGHLVDRLRESHGYLLEKSQFLSGKHDIGSRPWAGRISAWLTEQSRATHGTHYTLSAKEVQELANDPPIPFFVRFEAALDGNNGERLGILGSIVVADVIYGVLKHDRLSADDRIEGLQEELAYLSSITIDADEDPGKNIFKFLSGIEDQGGKISLDSVRDFLDET
jgi:hypothetical protein